MARTSTIEAMRAHKPKYALDPSNTALLSIDFQIAFGDNSDVPVPDAMSALENFKRAAKHWRDLGGIVLHSYIYFTSDAPPRGRMVDFFPEVSSALSEGSRAAAFYDGLIYPSDIVVRKTALSAVAGSDLLNRLHERRINTVVIGGLTTPICVQTTVDELSMSGIRMVVLEDACASQAMGSLSPRDAHRAAIDRMGYIFAQILSTNDFIASNKGG